LDLTKKAQKELLKSMKKSLEKRIRDILEWPLIEEKLEISAPQSWKEFSF
jgi:hypothetical protein